MNGNENDVMVNDYTRLFRDETSVDMKMNAHDSEAMDENEKVLNLVATSETLRSLQ